MLKKRIMDFLMRMKKRIINFFRSIWDVIIKRYVWEVQKCPGCKHYKITFLIVVDGDEGCLCLACLEE